MKKWFKKLLAYSTAICILLAGCSTPDIGEEKIADSKNLAMGRYVEEEIELPENAENIISLALKKDDTLEIIYSKNSPEKAYSYEVAELTKNKTWVKKEAPWLDELENPILWQVAYDSKDNMLVRYQENGAENQSEANKRVCYRLITEDDTVSQPYEVPKNEEGQNINGSMLLAENGDMIIQDSQSIVQYDAITHNVKNTYPVSGGVHRPNIAICGDTLCVDAGTYIEMFDLITGEKAGDTLGEETSTDSQMLYEELRIGKKQMASSPDGKSLFYINNGGIYRQIIGGCVAEKLVEGELTLLSMPSFFSRLLVPVEEDHIMILYNSDEKKTLMSYKYSKDIPTVPETELNVYSLNDDRTIRQAAALFQSKHPDVHVIYTVGNDFENTVTISDLARTLNTELLAGKGPDILIMDGLPINSYIEKNILMDLNGIIADEISQGKYLENIMNFGKQADGKRFVVPARFTLPVILGSKEVLDSITDFSSFISATEKLQRESADRYDEGILTTNGSRVLVWHLADICYPAWFNEDGSINDESLSEFLYGIKRLVNAGVVHNMEEQSFSSDISELSMSWFYDRNALGIAHIRSINDYMYPMSVIDKKETEIGKLALAPGQASKVFLSKSIIAINNNTKQKELSAEFIKTVLSEEVQSNDFYEGLPVNMAAYEKAFEDPYTDSVNGVRISDKNGQDLRAKWPSEEQLSELKANIKSLETPNVIDKDVLRAIIDPAEDYFTDKKNLDQTMTYISQNLEIYMSE